MTDLIKGLQNELACVVRQIFRECDQNCQECNLVFEDSEIIRAYMIAIRVLRRGLKVKEEKSMASKLSSEIYNLSNQIFEAENDAEYFERLIKEPEEHRFEMWHDHWVYFYKGDLQALVDSKRKRAEKLADTLRKRLNNLEEDNQECTTN